MKKFNLFLIFALLACVCLCLTGCGNNGDEEKGDYLELSEIIEHAKTLSYESTGASQIEKTGTPNFDVPTGGYDGSKVTIKFYHTMGSNLSDVLKKYIEEFNKIYPNITVEHEQVGGYDDVRNQVSTEITVGAQPNIAYCYPDHVALYNLAGAVANLDNLIDSQEADTLGGGILGLTDAQKADFIEGYYNEGMQFGDGLMYTMPFSKSTEVLYYNKTFFTENNIEVPTHWFSEGENDTKSMEYVCSKIKEIDPTSIPLGYDSSANWFITMCEQCGSDYTSANDPHYLFDNPTNRTILKAFNDWYNKGYVTTQTLYGAYTSGLFVAKEGQTRSYMSIGSSAGATHQRPAKDENGNYPFEVGIVSIPQMSETYARVISQGPSVCIFKKDNPQEVIASWLFVKFLTTSVEFQGDFSIASGYVPVLKSVADDPYYQGKVAKADGFDNISMLSAKVCLEQEKAYYTSPAFNGSSTARDQVGALLDKVLVLKENVDKELAKAFKDAIDECEYNG